MSFIYKSVRIVAFGFKALNFLLDIWQTWQFATGGGTAVVVTAIIAYLQNKPVWLIIVLAILAGVFVSCIIALIFKSYTFETTEGKRLKRLSRLIYDMHKRRCAVRKKFINKIDWDKVDSNKIFSPLLTLFTTERQAIAINDSTITDIASKFKEIDSGVDGASSAFLAMMKTSDTDLERAVERDYQYGVMQARLDGYKPYPSEVIRKDVDLALFESKGFNNLIVFQAYMNEPLTLKSLEEQTKLSVIKKWQVYSFHINTEDIMEDTVGIATTRLNEHIEDYLKDKKRVKQ